MKVSQSSRMISMMGVRVQARRVAEKKRKRGGRGDEEIIFGAANNKFCPRHTSAERGLPLRWRSFLIISVHSWKLVLDQGIIGMGILGENYLWKYHAIWMIYS